MTRVTIKLDVTADDVLTRRLKYVLNFIQNHPSAPDDVIINIEKVPGDVCISYGEKGVLYSMPNAQICFKKDPDLKAIKHRTVNFEKLKLFGFCSEQNNDRWYFEIDVFQTIFFHISRMEEWNVDKSLEDPHGMLASENHYLVKNGIHEIPVVDHLVYYFYKKLGLTPKIITTKFTISHDVDALLKFPSFYKFIRAIANVVFFQQNKIISLFRLLKTGILVIIGKENDPYDTFNWLLDIKSKKITDRFIYFLSGGKTKYENFFKIENPKVKEIIKSALQNEYIIGIHPSYMSLNNQMMMANEKLRLEQVCGYEIIDSRQHFLRYQVPDTGKILESLNISSDSSFGYRNKIGFRCGTGFPYKMYDFDNEKAFQFLEIPLVVMDMALIHQYGRNVDVLKTHLDKFLEQNKYFTHIAFNFHNSTFDPTLMEAEKFKSYYIQLFNHN